MSTILTAALLSVPIVGGASYLLRRHPHETAIIAGEAALYAVPVFSYMALTFVLVPLTAPVWLQVLSLASFAALATALAPICARRMSRRLDAAQDAKRRTNSKRLRRPEDPGPPPYTPPRPRKGLRHDSP